MMMMISCTTVLLLLLLTAGIAAEEATKNKKKKILSFGGNGMIGSETLHQLLSKKDDEYDITLVSRGSWPFDAQDRIAPHVKKHIVCDREEGLLETCADLKREVEESSVKDGPYYAVFDFSGYFPDWIEETTQLLKDKARVYIYVSTDSVYEVAEIEPYAETGRKMKETDAVRPDDEDLRDELNEFDEYGDEKLEGEDVLIEQRKNQGIPFVSLRFADVIGPRDNTGRFVVLYSWIKFRQLQSIPAIALPKEIVEATSITYVKDAAQSIIAAMDEANKGGVWDEAYNIACEEVFNVTSAITTIGEIMGQDDIRPLKIEDFGMSVYPSVTKGPMDITKAKDKLGFVPTSLDAALKDAVAFCDKMYDESSEFREDARDALIGILVEANEYESEEEQEEAIDGLVNEFSEFHGNDEL